MLADVQVVNFRGVDAGVTIKLLEREEGGVITLATKEFSPSISNWIRCELYLMVSLFSAVEGRSIEATSFPSFAKELSAVLTNQGDKATFRSPGAQMEMELSIDGEDYKISGFVQSKAQNAILRFAFESSRECFIQTLAEVEAAMAQFPVLTTD